MQDIRARPVSRPAAAGEPARQGFHAMPFDTLLPAALHGALTDQLPAPAALAFAAG